MKKTILLACVFLCFFAFSASANVTDDYLQGLGTFETGAIGSTDYYAGINGNVTVADNTENPLNTGNALKITAGDNSSTDSYAYIKPTSLADIAKGADYTKMRAIEFDFCITGGEYNSAESAYITMPTGMLRAYICSDNKHVDLKQHTSGGTTRITTIEMDKNYHIKLVYEVMDLDAYASGDTKYRARSVALFINGKVFNTSPVGSYFNNSYYHNYLNHSGADSSDKNYGFTISTVMNTTYSLRFGVNYLTKATLYVDNLCYYGVRELCYLADGNGDYSDGEEIISINPILKNKLYIKLTGQEKDASIYLALYNDKGQLSGVSKAGEIDFGDSESVGSFEKELTKQEGTYRIRIFCWKDMETLLPLSAMEKRSFSTQLSDENIDEAINFIYENLRSSMENNTSSPEGYLTYYDDESGSFTDIDYTDRSLSSWQPGKHLDRIASLTAICYSPKNAHYQDEELKGKIVKGLNYWYNNRDSIKSDNWWYNDRDVPETIAAILFFHPEGLDADVLEYFENRAKERYVNLNSGTGTLRYYSATGQGVFDRLNQSMKLAYTGQDDSKTVYEEFLKFFAAANHELTLKTYANNQNYSDGTAVVTNDTQSIKADYSYQEHQNLLLPASYGREFLKSLDDFLDEFKGTDIKLSEKAAEELSKILLDGFRWIQYNSYSDPSTTGRNYGAYGNTLKNSVDVKEYVDMLCTYLVENFPDAHYIDAVKAELNRTENFSGNRHFWQSDYTVHNRKNYHFSVRSASNRVKTSETTNNEGRQARYMGDGMIAILTRGAEYEGLGAAYDWNKLPGTTTDQSRSSITDGLLPDSSRGNTAFVGGVSDGRYGLHTFDYSRDGVAAKKSWFMFDDEIACLGAGISSESDGEIFTTINQTTLNGDVIVKTENADAIALANGDRAENGIEWILHDSIGYVFFEPESSVQIKNQSVTGDWHKTDTNYAEGVKTSTKDIFLLGQSHGVKPENAAYSYIMLPNTDSSKLASYTMPVSVLANTSDRQAVWHTTLNMLQAAFYEAGSIVLPNGVTVSVDNKCALMIEFDGNDYKISISNPENTALDVTVSLSGEINASHSFNEGIGEKGNDAGKTYFYSSK